MSSAADQVAVRSLPGQGLLHPLALAAMGLLILNDHVLKDAYPGAFTGKLSDVAGLVFFPLLLVGLVEVVRRGVPATPLQTAFAVMGTGLLFALVQVWGPAGDAYRIGLGLLQWPLQAVTHGPGHVGRVALTPDVTDLAALPALALAWWIATRHSQPNPEAR